MSKPSPAAISPLDSGESTASYLVSTTLGEKIGLSLVAIYFGWFFLCGGSAVWLAIMVPITAEDMSHASWLGSYTTATHFSGVMCYALIATCLLMAAAMGLVKQSFFAAAGGILMAAALWAAGSETTMLRVGIANDSIKIGCYVYETKECHEMLGVPVGKALSRYEQDGDSNHGYNADWYTKAMEGRSPSPVDMIPGGYLVRAPFVVLHTAALNKKIAGQRNEVMQFKLGVPLASAR